MPSCTRAFSAEDAVEVGERGAFEVLYSRCIVSFKLCGSCDAPWLLAASRRQAPVIYMVTQKTGSGCQVFSQGNVATRLSCV